MDIYVVAAELISRDRRNFNSKLPEWGRHIRSSPHSSPELLNELRDFVPHWDVFSNFVHVTYLCPIEFHDVVQWLKVHPKDIVVD